MSTSNQLPLQPSNARKLILDLFEQKAQWLRADLVKALIEIHTSTNGIMGQQDPTLVVKKVLRYLEEEGRVVKTGAKGLWAKDVPSVSLKPEYQISPPNEVDLSVDVDDEISETKAQTIDIGEGLEAVYLYYSPSDKELADIKGNLVWECKIGMTTVLPVENRIFSQGIKTAFSKMPVIALIIRTDNAVCLERAIHSALRMVEADAPDSPATEWFITNPQKIIDWYHAFTEATKKLL